MGIGCSCFLPSSDLAISSPDYAFPGFYDLDKPKTFIPYFFHLVIAAGYLNNIFRSHFIVSKTLALINRLLGTRRQCFVVFITECFSLKESAGKRLTGNKIIDYIN